MISVLAIAGASFLAIFAICMLVLVVSAAIANEGYVGKHRHADRSPAPQRRGATRTYRAQPVHVRR